MPGKRTWRLIAILVFIQLYAVQLLSFSMPDQQRNWTSMFSLFDLTQVIYTVVTILLTRVAFMRYYRQKKWLMLAFGLVQVVALFIVVRFFLEQGLTVWLFGKKNYYDPTFPYYIIDNIQYAFVTMFPGVIVFFAEESARHKERSLALEVSRKEAEMQYLMASMNPHFLYNSLNNIYALVESGSSHAGDAILQLTALTRYAISENAALVPLGDELEKVHQYIGLQSLRYDHPVTIQIRNEVDTSTKVPPFLLITLAENACKHGDLNGWPVSIHLFEQQGQMVVETRNRLGRSGSTDSRGGVGLSNIHRRLELLFPGQVVWKQQFTETEFSLSIQFPLHAD